MGREAKKTHYSVDEKANIIHIELNRFVVVTPCMTDNIQNISEIIDHYSLKTLRALARAIGIISRGKSRP